MCFKRPERILVSLEEVEVAVVVVAAAEVVVEAMAVVVVVQVATVLPLIEAKLWATEAMGTVEV